MYEEYIAIFLFVFSLLLALIFAGQSQERGHTTGDTVYIGTPLYIGNDDVPSQAGMWAFSPRWISGDKLSKEKVDKLFKSGRVFTIPNVDGNFTVKSVVHGNSSIVWVSPLPPGNPKQVIDLLKYSGQPIDFSLMIL